MWCLLEANRYGLIDSRYARRYHRTWRRKCRIAIEYVLSEKARQEAGLLVQYLGSRLGSGMLDRSSYLSLSDSQRSALRMAFDAICPWEGFRGWNLEHAQAIDQYKQYCGDPHDPAYRAEIERTAMELCDHARQAEESENSLEQLINERTLRERV